MKESILGDLSDGEEARIRNFFDPREEGVDPSPRGTGVDDNMTERLEEIARLVKPRSPLATALLEDEAVRLRSQRDSEAFLLRREEEASGMSNWAWAVLWALFGVLLTVTLHTAIPPFWAFITGIS